MVNEPMDLGLERVNIPPAFPQQAQQTMPTEIGQPKRRRGNLDLEELGLVKSTPQPPMMPMQEFEPAPQRRGRLDFGELGLTDRESAFDALYQAGVEPTTEDAGKKRGFYPWELGKAMGGVGIGTLNAVGAFTRGYMVAGDYDPEQYKEMPWYQQSMVNVGSGLVSAWESISKKGSWGVDYRKFHEVKFGKTIEETLRDMLVEQGVEYEDAERRANFMAPTVEIMGELATDPLTYIPIVGWAAKAVGMAGKVPKGWVGKIPQKVIDDINKLEVEEVETVRKIFRDAYDEGLWGIQEGGTFERVRPRPTPFEGGIVEGESWVKGVKVPETPPAQPSVRPLVDKAPTGQQIVTQAAEELPEVTRIRNAALERKKMYVAEAHLARRTGQSAVDFIKSVRGRLGQDARHKVDKVWGVEAPVEKASTTTRTAPFVDDYSKETQDALNVIMTDADEHIGPLSGTFYRVGGPKGKHGTFFTDSESWNKYNKEIIGEEGFKPEQVTIAHIELPRVMYTETGIYGSGDNLGTGLASEAIWSRYAPDTLKAHTDMMSKKYLHKTTSGLFIDAWVKSWARKQGYDAIAYVETTGGVAKIRNLQVVKLSNKIVEQPISQVAETQKFPFSDALTSREFGRPKQAVPQDEIAYMDLGVLVRAAEDVFGSAATREALEQVSKEKTLLGSVAKEVVKRKKGAEGVTPPTPVGTQQITPKAAVINEIEPGLSIRAGDEVDDIFDALKAADIDAPKPSETIVPGKTFKHFVPKKGETVPGVGKIIEVVEAKEGKWWVRFTNEEGMMQLKPLDTVMDMVKAQEPPQVTLDMLGFQQTYEGLVKGLKRLYATKKARDGVPFQHQVPEHLIWTRDAQDVVKHRKTGKYKGANLMAPAVKGIDRNIIQTMNDLPDSLWRTLMTNPIRQFRYMGEQAMELFYWPIKEGEHAVDVEVGELNKWLKGLKKTVSGKSDRRIYIHGVSKQKSHITDPKTGITTIYEDGLERLKASGVDTNNLPVLTPKEEQVYQVMRKKYDEFYDRISAANIAAGHKPFPKVENYFTFMHDFNRLVSEGFDLTRGEGLQRFTNFIHPHKVPFKYEKYRGRQALPLELSAFNAMESYAYPALRHIHLSPKIARMREIIGPYKDALGEEWRLSQEKPKAYEFIDYWLSTVAGIKQGTLVVYPRVDRAIRTLNTNIAAALLAGTIRTVFIQPTALKNTFIDIGLVHTLRGIADATGSIYKPELWREAMSKSLVLRGRLSSASFDASAQELFTAVMTRGSFMRGVEKSKREVAKKLMIPMRMTDIFSAVATWRGAYKQALGKGLDDIKAARYADDVVIRTQASGAVSDVARLQTTAIGRLVSSLQTFVINDWDFLVRDVLGIGNPRMVNKDRFVKVIKLLIGTAMVNMFYEDLLGMDSPYGRPVKTFMEETEKGTPGPDVAVRVGKELLEGVPLIGGALRYGERSLFGPAGSVVSDMVSTLHKGEMPSVGQTAEFAGKLRGVPATGQVSRIGKRLARGDDFWTALVGKSKPPTSGGRGRGKRETRGTARGRR